VAGWIAALSADQWSNWDICVRESWYGTGSPRGSNVRAGDDLYIWHAKVGLVAMCEVGADAEPVVGTSKVPWPNRERYRYVWPISVLIDKPNPVLTSWTELDLLAGLGRVPASQLPPVRTDSIPAIRRLFGIGPSQEPRASADLAWQAGDLAELQSDQRISAIRAIDMRRGQPAFRAELLRAYRGSCAISDTSVESVLEAAHISPYRGVQTNRIDNGLLLRADLHTLFDLKRVTVLPTGRVRVDPKLRETEYDQFDLRQATLPIKERDRPLAAFLEWHNSECNWITESVR
jgi:putative restriction endonuclease